MGVRETGLAIIFLGVDDIGNLLAPPTGNLLADALIRCEISLASDINPPIDLIIH